jgi:hypothetical protein
MDASDARFSLWPASILNVVSYVSLAAWSVLEVCGNLVLGTPLKTLYFEGPALSGYGFWAGASSSDICSQITGVAANLWDSQPEACGDLLHKKFRAFSMGVYALLYAVAIYKCTQILVFRYMVIGPLLYELRETLTMGQKMQ